MLGNVLGGRGFTQERRLPLQIRENNRECGSGRGQWAKAREILKNGLVALNRLLEETWKAGLLTWPNVQKQYLFLHEM